MTTETLVVSSDEITFEEYLVAYDGVHAEWVDGRVSLEDIEGARHSRIRRFIATILQLWAEGHDAGEVYVAPLTVRLKDWVARQPDVFFVGSHHAERVRPTHVEGAPDLVVEISGRASRSRARGEAWSDYETAGVAEYWLVDPDRNVAESWRLGESGWYDAIPLGDPAVLRSEVLQGLAIPAAWLWQEPPPRLTEVVKEWRLI